MKRTRSTIVLTILGIVILLFVVGAGTAVWFFLSVFDSVDVDETQAAQSLTETRARFAGDPVLDLRDEQIVVLRKPPAVAPGGALQNVHALTWNAEDGTMSRMVLPFWLVRMKNSAVDLAVTAEGARISVTVEEIERYGPTLLLDHAEEDGSRILVWTE